MEGILPTSLDPWSKLQAFPEAMAGALELVGESWEGNLQGTEVDPRLPVVAIDPTIDDALRLEGIADWGDDDAEGCSIGARTAFDGAWLVIALAFLRRRRGRISRPCWMISWTA